MHVHIHIDINMNRGIKIHIWIKAVTNIYINTKNEPIYIQGVKLKNIIISSGSIIEINMSIWMSRCMFQIFKK